MFPMLPYYIIVVIVCYPVNAGLIKNIFNTVKNLQTKEDVLDFQDIFKNNNILKYPLFRRENTNVSDYVSFHLFNRENPKEGYVLKAGDLENVRKSPFDAEKPTKVIIHGWLDSLKRIWLQELKDIYLIVGDYNVIIVDWSPMAWREYFFTSVPSTRAVGHEVRHLLESLIQEKSLSLSRVHLVGYSLGGQISGFVGLLSSGKIGRITGLDPAGPGFEFPFLKKKDDRLDPSDAIFVDVIHTSGAGMGFKRPIGHVDFYPNGGVARQPGCSILNSGERNEYSTNKSFEYIYDPVYCSHHKAPEYMIGSIKDKNTFVARRCTDWTTFERGECEHGGKAFMGEYATPDLRGLYFLRTNDSGS